MAFERFLARLATSESSSWVLKGAFALELRLGLRAERRRTSTEATPIQAEPLLGASSLVFADVAELQLPVISLEQHVAEKLHAYTGTFGQDQRESTRVKDLVDLVLIGELAEIDAERLHQALTTTFAQRGRQPLPNALPLPPSSWARPYAVLAREVGVAVDIEAGHAAAARLLDPVLRKAR